MKNKNWIIIGILIAGILLLAIFPNANPLSIASRNYNEKIGNIQAKGQKISMDLKTLTITTPGKTCKDYAKNQNAKYHAGLWVENSLQSEKIADLYASKSTYMGTKWSGPVIACVGNTNQVVVVDREIGAFVTALVMVSLKNEMQREGISMYLLEDNGQRNYIFRPINNVPPTQYIPY